MSKGLGKTQQKILDELQQRPAFYLDELATTRAERVSLNRAAWKLADTGQIDVTSYCTGARKVVVKRRGYMFDRTKYNRDQWQERHDRVSKIISVEQVPSVYPFNT